MVRQPTVFHEPNLLIVEGADELYFLIRVLEHLNIQTIQIHPIEGINGLRAKIKAVANTPGFANVQRIGMLADSDSNPAGRQESIRDAFQNAKIPVPPVADQLLDGPPKVMYSLLPAAAVSGCLEDLVIESFATTANAPHINTFLQNVGLAPNLANSRWSKSWTHTMLSTFPEPGKKIGEATKAGYIDVTHQAFQPVRDFLNLLMS